MVPKRSRAELRIRVEQMLARREPPPTEDWETLGDEALVLLTELLDDAAIKRHDAMRHRVIATIGQIGVRSALPSLGAILTDAREDALTRTYCASALGRSGHPEAVRLLGRAVGDKDEMVRRQVVLALARSGSPEAIPYLTTLVDDPTKHVASVASKKLRDLAKELKLDIQRPRKPDHTARRKKK